MQSLERQKIRKALGARLSPLFSKIKNSSQGVRNYQKNSLVVDLSSQTFEIFSMVPRSYVVTTTIGLELVVFEVSDISKEMDSSIDEVMFEMENDRTLGGVVEDMHLNLVETSLDETTEKKIGFARIEFITKHMIETKANVQDHLEFSGVNLNAV